MTAGGFSKLEEAHIEAKLQRRPRMSHTAKETIADLRDWAEIDANTGYGRNAHMVSSPVQHRLSIGPS